MGAGQPVVNVKAGALRQGFGEVGGQGEGQAGMAWGFGQFGGVEAEMVTDLGKKRLEERLFGGECERGVGAGRIGALGQERAFVR